jgi:hypothetical protein
MSYLQLNKCHKTEKYSLGGFGSYQQLINEHTVEPKQRYIYNYEPQNTYKIITDNDTKKVGCMCHNKSNLKHNN